jgi:hypothetical protein
LYQPESSAKKPIMKYCLVPALIAALTLPAFAASSAPPLTPEQNERIRCVAALAIVANEQERGVGDWNSLPSLRSRGAHFAGVVGDTLTGEGGRTKEAVRDSILNAVKSFQTAGESALSPQEVIKCIELMDRIDPPPPPPGLTECAAMVSLAATEVRKREGFNDNAKLLVTFATVLDSRARAKLRSEGKTEAENDMILGLKKEELSAAAKARGKNAEPVGPDMAACLELAKP